MSTTLKIILGVIGALIALPLIIALFIKKEWSTVAVVTVPRPKNEVFEYLKLLKNQDEYSVWAAMDPGMKKSFRGTDGTPGFVSRWESKNENVGTGEQEIKAITEGERIDYELRFYEPFEDKAISFMSVEPGPSGSATVKWGVSGTMPYPFNLMMLTMDMEGDVHKDLQAGLDNLKKKMETR